MTCIYLILAPLIELLSSVWLLIPGMSVTSVGEIRIQVRHITDSRVGRCSSVFGKHVLHAIYGQTTGYIVVCVTRIQNWVIAANHSTVWRKRQKWLIWDVNFVPKNRHKHTHAHVCYFVLLATNPTIISPSFHNREWEFQRFQGKMN